jgi:NADH dehydrogenase
LAVRLAKAGQNDVRLIDSRETHIWKPRIHELAAGLRRGQVDELDYAGLAELWGFAFERGELCDVDPTVQELTLSEIHGRDGRTLVAERKIAYQALVLALGV